ncbi:deoxyribodipyrimidine photolyase, partial [Pseudonocardia sp. KRD-169]|nr:deoxyribodipyrimidine photolyase [Pseudonocardia abyssalis]
VFLAETLADLGTRRPVQVHRGVVADELAGRAVAVTHAPVPGFAARAAAVAPVRVHPWPWLFRPHAGPVTSYSAWRKKAR